MARTHARILTTIWQDEDFVALSSDAQRLYLLLLSQPDVLLCGVLAYRPNRWAKGCTHTDLVDVEYAIGELEQARFVVIDRDEEELLIRTLVRNDGVLAHPNMRKAMWRSLDAVLSEMLRAAVLAEVPQEHHAEGIAICTRPLPGPVAAASPPVPDAIPEPIAMPSRCDPGTHRGAIPEPIPMTAGERDGKGGVVALPHSRSVSPRKRGKPIDDDFEVTDAMREWARDHAPNADVERETERMCDWARAKGETKRDWAAAWRNWLRKASDERRSTNGRGHFDDSHLIGTKPDFT